MPAIVVTCWDGYADLWPGFRKSIKRFKKFDAPVYMASVKGYASNGEEGFIDVTTGEGEYCGRLMSALRQIHYNRVFILLEDYYITEPWTDKQWEAMTSQHWHGENTGKVHYGIPSDMYSFEKGNLFKRGSRYATSLEPGMWDRAFFLDCLRPHETAWDFEVEGNRRMWRTHDRDIYFHEWRGYENIKRKANRKK